MNTSQFISIWIWVASSYISLIILLFVLHRTNQSYHYLKNVIQDELTMIAAKRNRALTFLLVLSDFSMVVVGTLAVIYGDPAPDTIQAINLYVLVGGRVMLTLAAIVILKADLRINRL